MLIYAKTWVGRMHLLFPFPLPFLPESSHKNPVYQDTAACILKKPKMAGEFGERDFWEIMLFYSYTENLIGHYERSRSNGNKTGRYKPIRTHFSEMSLGLRWQRVRSYGGKVRWRKLQRCHEDNIRIIPSLLPACGQKLHHERTTMKRCFVENLETLWD